METKRETEGPWRPDLWPKSVPNRETRHAKVERKKTNKLQLKEDDGARQLEQQTASRRRQLLVL